MTYLKVFTERFTLCRLVLSRSESLLQDNLRRGAQWMPSTVTPPSDKIYSFFSPVHENRLPVAYWIKKMLAPQGKLAYKLEIEKRRMSQTLFQAKDQNN